VFRVQGVGVICLHCEGHGKTSVLLVHSLLLRVWGKKKKFILQSCSLQDKVVVQGCRCLHRESEREYLRVRGFGFQNLYLEFMGQISGLEFRSPGFKE